MDINTILPLILKNNATNTTKNESQTGTEQGNAESMQLISSLLNGNVDQSSLITALANNSGNPQLAQTLSLAQNLKGNNTKKNNPQGLKAIKPFVNNDIMGKLTKYFS